MIAISIKDMNKFYGAKQVLHNVNLQIKKGEVLALIGESGCGKSTLASIITGLLPYDSGSLSIMNHPPIAPMTKPKLSTQAKPQLHRVVQLVLQNPYTSLDPKRTIEELLISPLIYNKISPNKKDALTKVSQMLDEFSLPSASLKKYPNQFSGGQLQRLSILRALSLSPQILIADEIISALDIELQHQILKLLSDLREARGLTCLFISHNLNILGTFADKIAVMHKGQIVETRDTRDFFTNPHHPYSQQLINSIPRFSEY